MKLLKMPESVRYWGDIEWQEALHQAIAAIEQAMSTREEMRRMVVGG